MTKVKAGSLSLVFSFSWKVPPLKAGTYLYYETWGKSLGQHLRRERPTHVVRAAFHVAKVQFDA